MAPISVPIASRLPSSLRIASTSVAVTRAMGRLTRPSLVSLALDWLDEQNQALTAPYLRRRARDADNDDDDDDDADGFYPPAETLEALQDYYADQQKRKGSKREVLDRMLEGDWRHGLSMYQLAMADLQYLYDHPTSQKWTAFQIVPLKATQRDSETPDGGNDDDADISAVLDKASLAVPRFHPSSFLRNLQAQILPDIKVHYNFDRHKTLPLLILRIFILDSPYNTSLATAAPASSGETTSVESSRTVYIAFPDASPFIYLSSAQSSSAGGDKTPGSGGGGAASSIPSDARSLRSLVVEAIPKALSRPRERYALKPTNLATRNLAELLQRRGAGRTNTAGGGWGIYADDKTIESPLSTVPPPSVASQLESATTTTTTTTRDANTPKNEGAPAQSAAKRAASPGARREERLAKRRKQVAAARFGKAARIDDGFGVERVDIVMQDPYPGGARGRREEEGGEAREPRRPDEKRRLRSGRRSQIDAVLAREDEDEEAEEDAQRAPRTAGAEEDREDGEDGEDGGNDSRSKNEWRPRVAFTFQGPHVFAGIRQLVEAGIIDGEKMPGWLTGEDGVTVGAVRDGRIRGHKGSGMP